jgi:(1->4)-alpha-D-glucan 1-alpha-D-glucosylmutase
MGDPDSRRPVDYVCRSAQFARIRNRLGEDRRAAMREFLASWHDGSIKMAVLHALLEERKSNADLFARASYEAVTSSGPASERICAFWRQHESASMLVAVRLFSAGGTHEEFEQTKVPVPTGWNDAHEVFTHRELAPTNGAYCAAELFADLPVAVLLPRAAV